MQSQTIPKETFIIVIFGGMIRGYDSGVWFAQIELPAFTKNCTRLKKTQPYICLPTKPWKNWGNHLVFVFPLMITDYRVYDQIPDCG